MRFAHIADCHLGGWREPKLQELNLEVFRKSIDICINEKVDFVLIAGDLFDIAMPQIEILEETFAQFRRLKESSIKCYLIAGSHDYSVSGKTFLNVLEKAGFCDNISKLEEKEDATYLEFFIEGDLLLAGIPGKKAGLERRMYKNLVMKDLKQHSEKIKIFMMHTTITEVKPKELAEVETIGGVYLPDGFDYYAAGHLHKVKEKRIDKRMVIYPGPLFPNNFGELEELKAGNFCIVDIDKEKKFPVVKRVEIKLRDVVVIEPNVEGKDAETATAMIIKDIENTDIKEKIVLLKIKGKLNGKISDIRFENINLAMADSYAHLRNTSQLLSSELEIQVSTKSDNIEQIEEEVITRYIRQQDDEFSKYFMSLINSLEIEKREGETSTAFEKRVNEEAVKILQVGEVIK
ncbi:MAG: DNA repair exonuclease [archaeon]